MKEYGNAQFDRRRYPRLDFSLPLAFHATDQAQPKGLTSNLSLGGMMAYLPHRVVQGQVLEVTLLLPVKSEKQIFKAKAEVAWARDGQFEGGWVCQVGLRLIDIPKDFFDIWLGFLLAWQGEKETEA